MVLPNAVATPLYERSCSPSVGSRGTHGVLITRLGRPNEFLSTWTDPAVAQLDRAARTRGTNVCKAIHGMWVTLCRTAGLQLYPNEEWVSSSTSAPGICMKFGPAVSSGGDGGAQLLG